MSYRLSDLEGDYKRRPRYIAFSKQQKILLERIDTDNSLNNTIASKFIDRLKFANVTTKIFKPITETQKETAKTIVEPVLNKQSIGTKNRETE